MEPRQLFDRPPRLATPLDQPPLAGAAPPTTSRRSITQGTGTLFFSHDVDHQRFKLVAPEGTTLVHRQ
jgi:hypothetical protein